MADKFTTSTELYNHYLACAVESLNSDAVVKVLSVFGQNIEFDAYSIKMSLYTLVRSRQTNIVSTLAQAGVPFPDEILDVAISESSPAMIRELFQYFPRFFQSRHFRYAGQYDLSASVYLFYEGRLDILDVLRNNGIAFTKEDISLAAHARNYFGDVKWGLQLNYLLTHFDYDTSEASAISPAEFSKGVVNSNDPALTQKVLENPALAPLITHQDALIEAFDGRKVQFLRTLQENDIPIIVKDDSIAKHVDTFRTLNELVHRFSVDGNF